MKLISSTSVSFLLLAFFDRGFQVKAASDATLSRFDLLEKRIESLEKLAKTQSETIQGLMRRGLESSNDGCLPKRNQNNVCVYDSDAEFLYHNANIVFDSSIVRFTGPIKDFNAKHPNGTNTNQTTYSFTSQIIFDSTDVRVSNSNVTFTAEHDYEAFQKNETQLSQHYGFVTMNNTEMALNSSRLIVTGPDPRNVNRSLYDDLAYEKMFSTIGFSYSNITIDDSNTTFSTNSSSGADESNVIFNNTKILNNYTDITMSHSETSVSDSSVSYGKNTNIQWFGSSSKAYFTNGVDISITDSDVNLKHSTLELTGDRGKLISRVDTFVRGPDSGSPIDFQVSRRVEVSYEQDYTMNILSDVVFAGGSDVKVDNTGSFKIDGKFESNNKAEFHGDVKLVDVDVNVDRDLIIDGQNGGSRAGIEFRSGVDVRIYNDLKVAKDFEVSGHADIRSLYVSNEATVGGRLYCQRGATISGDSSTSDSISSIFSSQLLKVEGSALIQRDLDVDGTLSANPLNFDGDVVISGNAKAQSLTVTSTATVGGTATVGTIKGGSGIITGELTAGTIKAENDIFFDNLHVSGTATLVNLNVLNGTKTQSLIVEDANVTGDLHIGGTFKPKESRFDSIVVSGTADVGSLKASGSVTAGGALTSQSLKVNADADIGGNLKVNGFLPPDTVFNDIVVLGTASIETLSATSASISSATTTGNLNVNGNADVSGDLSVGGTFEPGDIVFYDLLVLGTASVGTLDAEFASISNTAKVKTLNVIANANVTGSLSVEGTFQPTDTVFNDVTVTGTASVGTLSATSATISGTGRIQTLKVDANADVTGSMNIGGTFAPAESEFVDITVTGTATINSLSATSASVSNTASIQTLNVAGNADVTGSLSVEGMFDPGELVFNELLVLGEASFGSVSAESGTFGNLNVNADADVSGGLSVGGTFAPQETLFSDISVTGTASIASLSAETVSISDTANINTLSVGSNVAISGDLSVDGSFSLDVLQCQDITVSGTAIVSSIIANTASVDQVATIATLNVGLNADVQGDLTVGGTINGV